MENWLDKGMGGCTLLGPFLRFMVGVIGVGVMVMTYPDSLEAAAQCQTFDNHQVCLESIKRSAKYHWEYRVTVSLDGKNQPEQRYDCRQSTTNLASAVPSVELDRARIGQWICRLMGYQGR